jgi:hypothetical protein
MDSKPMISRWSWTTGFWALLLLLPTETAAQSLGVRVDPVMVKGPMAAAVTIVEFSDYQ